MIFVLNNIPCVKEIRTAKVVLLCFVCSTIYAAVTRILAQTRFHIIVRMSKSAFEEREAISCCLLPLTGHFIRMGSSTSRAAATHKDDDLNEVEERFRWH